MTAAGSALVGELSDAGRPFLGQVAARLGDDVTSVTAALERLAEAAARVRAAETAGEVAGSDVAEAAP